MGGDAAQNVRLENVDDVLDPESGVDTYMFSQHTSAYDTYMTHIQYVNPAT